MPKSWCQSLAYQPKPSNTPARRVEPLELSENFIAKEGDYDLRGMVCLILVIEPSMAGLAQGSQRDLVGRPAKGERHAGFWANVRIGRLNVISRVTASTKRAEKETPLRRHRE